MIICLSKLYLWKVQGGMGESAVSQAIRRLVLRMGEDRKLKKKVLGIEEEVKSCQLCRPALIAGSHFSYTGA
jgi:hypothetical protein